MIWIRFLLGFFLYHIMQYNNAHVTKEALKPYSSMPNVKLDGTRTRYVERKKKFNRKMKIISGFELLIKHPYSLRLETKQTLL